MKMVQSAKNLMRGIREHFRRYAHALRFAIGLHGAKKFHPIVKYKHYQTSSGARASLTTSCVVVQKRKKNANFRCVG